VTDATTALSLRPACAVDADETRWVAATPAAATRTNCNAFDTSLPWLSAGLAAALAAGCDAARERRRARQRALT